MSAYHLYIDNQVQGPYSKAEVESRLSSGLLAPDTQVSVDGGKWIGVTDALSASNRVDVALPQLHDSPQVASNPYFSPESQQTTPPSIQKIKHPGFGRLGYAIFVFGIALFSSVLSTMAGGEPIFVLAGQLVMLLPLSERLKNIGRNPAWCFLALVPLVGLFITLPCLIAPPGYQQHRKLDTAAKIILGLMAALIVCLIISMLTW